MYKDKITKLFQKWKAEPYYSESFNEDGIIDIDAWKKANRKILFLLKETNDYPGSISDLIKISWDEFPKNVYRNCARWAYTLLNSSKNFIPSFADSEVNLEQLGKKTLYPVAIMNIKKLTGKPNADMEKIEQFAKSDSTYIQKEIEIINPEIIVCGNTFYMLQSHIYPANFFKRLNGHHLVYLGGNRIYFDLCHPGAHFRSDILYYSLCGAFQTTF